MSKKRFSRFSVVSAGAEHLVMGYLMRRNILTYKAPPNNEGYDLICIHPDPRHRRSKEELDVVRVQVKSRYATDNNRAPLVQAKSLNAFQFLVVAFLNIGRFSRGRDGSAGSQEPEFYTFPADFIRKHLDKSHGWEKVRLRPLGKKIEPFRNQAGFELIAKALGVPRPKRVRDAEPMCE